MLAAAAAGCSPPPTANSVFWGPVKSNDAGAARADTGAAIQDAGIALVADAAPIIKFDGSVVFMPVDAPTDTQMRDTGPPDRVDAFPTDAGYPLPGACLGVVVTTVTADEDYAPRNIGVIWIQTTGKKFVKTLRLWASRRVSHLVEWNAVTAAAGLSRNKVDAVSSATASTHRTYTAGWNCTDAAKMNVPDGMYEVCFEMTEWNAYESGDTHVDCVPFTKGRERYRLEPPDEPTFANRYIGFAPP